MRLLVCGGRGFLDRRWLYAVLDRIHRERGVAVLIHGANGKDEDGEESFRTGKPTVRGADMMGHEWAVDRGVEPLPFPANWRDHGWGAGPIRNRHMLNEGKPDAVVAFPGGNGTAHMRGIASKAGVPVYAPVPPKPASVTLADGAA